MERVPDGIALAPDAALTEAQRLLDAGMPFHAHEVLEGTWKAAPQDERKLWQGLAQLAVGMTHVLRGNASGAQALLRRGRDRIAPYAGAPPHDIDVAGTAHLGRLPRRPERRRDGPAHCAQVAQPLSGNRLLPGLFNWCRP